MSAPPPNLPISGEWFSGGFDSPVVSAPVSPPRPVESQPNPLAIVLPFIERERAQVLRLLGHILKLSGKPLSRTLYLVPFKKLKIDDVLTQARATFADVQVIADAEGVVSDWKQGDKVRDAAGPNSLFRQAAWFFYLRPTLGPWLWLEPDCVPLSAGWCEAIETAYRASGKPFLGARMKFQEGEYLNGAAVYPRDSVARAPALVTRATWTQFPDMEIAFDVAGGADVLRQATISDLIQLEYRNGAEPHSGAVLFHGDRDGSILQKLLSGGVSESLHGGSLPKNKAGAAAQSPVKRKRGDAKCRKTSACNGAAKFDPESAPTVGDEIRYHVGALTRLATNANRTTRIRAKLLRELRKAKLVRR